MSTKWRYAAVALALLALAGCSRGAYDPSSPVDKQPEKTLAVVQYRGSDLFCIEQEVAHGALTYSCDFAGFYAKPAHHGSKRRVAHVSLVTMPYEGHRLYCFAFDTGHSGSGYSCDFERYYQENPPNLRR